MPTICSDYHTISTSRTTKQYAPSMRSDKIGKIQKHYSGNARFLLARATSLISAREKGAALAQHTEAMQRVKARSAEQQNCNSRKETALGATPSRSPSPPRGTPVQLAPPMRFP